MMHKFLIKYGNGIKLSPLDYTIHKLDSKLKINFNYMLEVIP